jgi:hypothetical protein
MAVMVQYCTRESVKTALDEAETARSNAQIDDAILSGARDVEGLCSRPEYAFLPVLATRHYDWPNGRGPADLLRFDDGHTLISATAVTTDNGATTLAPSSYFLEPTNRPPYTAISINRASAASFSSRTTSQRAIGITGTWGWADLNVRVGALTATLAAAEDAAAALTWSTARFGVGDLLLVGAERMVITERSFVDTAQALQAGIGASEADVTLQVEDGTAFAAEEIIAVGGERMRVIDVIGDVLIVKRAQDGSQLAEHDAADAVHALTGVELARAVLGTELAEHAPAAVVYRWKPPALLATLNRAYALNTLLQERSGYARVAGTGEFAREFTGRGIAAIEADVKQVYGVKARHRSI